MEPTKPSLAILYPGNCEPLKASFHGVALILAAVMGAYNAAAWVRRRQSHLAINATIYIAAVSGSNGMWRITCCPVCRRPFLALSTSRYRHRKDRRP